MQTLDNGIIGGNSRYFTLSPDEQLLLVSTSATSAALFCKILVDESSEGELQALIIAVIVIGVVFWLGLVIGAGYRRFFRTKAQQISDQRV